MSARIDEIAPDIFRICLYVPQFDMQFNHFLVRDDEPLLYHAGMRGMFPALREAVSGLIDPATIRYVGYSHFEVDECGALNDWLELAPRAEAVHGTIGAMVNLSDYAIRPPRTLQEGETLVTGRRRYRWIATPHLPHGWDAGALFEETGRTLFVSDLFHQFGEQDALAGEEILERAGQALEGMQASPLMEYVPYTPKVPGLLGRLAATEPRTLAVMHGSSFEGNGAKALEALGPMFRKVFGAPLDVAAKRA